MLHSKRSPAAPSPAALDTLDVQLSALVYLLVRCARGPCDAACQRLAADHLELVAANPHAGERLRQTTARLACRLAWHAPLPAGFAGECACDADRDQHEASVAPRGATRH